MNNYQQHPSFSHDQPSTQPPYPPPPLYRPQPKPLPHERLLNIWHAPATAALEERFTHTDFGICREGGNGEIVQNVETDFKDKAAKMWCENATKLTGKL